MLYGGFVELLDDHVPGMWAEMLGDRGFEGILPTANWDYFRGEPNLADRDWDKDPGWDYDRQDPFNGLQSVRLTSTGGRPARLTQGQCAVRRGMGYLLSGHFRGDSGSLRITASLRTLLPDGTWMILGALELPRPAAAWGKFGGTIVSRGTTDRAVFEVQVSGPGHLWLDKLSLMPRDNVDGWRKDVVEATKELGPPVIRWGGSAIDPGAYRWEEAIGDRDARRPVINKPWGRLNSNDVGVEEFVHFCRVVGAEPLICVSLSDGPASAARMVEYLNGSPESAGGRKRAANGRREPYGVKYWQVGNEIDRPGYVTGIIEFSQAIKKTDPGAIVLSSLPTPELLERAGADVDIVCPHYYQSDLEGVDADLTAIEGWIGKSAGSSRIRIGVTEWNIDAGNWGLGRGKLNTLGCALFEARFLNVLHRHAAAVTLACRSNLVNSFCAGTIQTNAEGLYRTPSFLVMALYRRHSRPVPLRVLAEVPVSVDLSACASEDRSSLSLFVVNSGKEPVSLDLDLSGFNPGLVLKGGEVIADTQDRRQVDIINSFVSPARVRSIKMDKPSGSVVMIPALSIAVIEAGRN
jgi:alpha-N-arabinofuranosidase